MNADQRFKIICILASSVSDMYKAHNIFTSDEFNWKRAEECFLRDQKINGEDYLLKMLEPKE